MTKSHAESSTSSKDEPQSGSGTPFWEQVVGYLGLVIVIGVIIFLLYEASQPVTPPDIMITVKETIAQGSGYLVEIEAVNQGGMTAATVVVEGTLTAADDPETLLEQSDVTFDYVPLQSSRQGGLFFSHDPEQYQLEIQVKSYIRP